MKPINYTRIAMDDIHSEARRIALSWMEGWEEWMKTDVMHKVKLASDIQNFAIAYHQHEMEQLNKQVVSGKQADLIILQNFCDKQYDIATDNKQHGQAKAFAKVLDEINNLLACASGAVDKTVSVELHECPVCKQKAGKSYLLSKLPTICQKCDHAWNRA